MGEVDFRGRFENKALNHCDQAVVLNEAWQGYSDDKVKFTCLHDKMVISEFRLDSFGIIRPRIYHDHHHIVFKIHSDAVFRRLILFNHWMESFNRICLKLHEDLLILSSQKLQIPVIFRVVFAFSVRNSALVLTHETGL